MSDEVMMQGGTWGNLWWPLKIKKYAFETWLLPKTHDSCFEDAQKRWVAHAWCFPAMCATIDQSRQPASGRPNDKGMQPTTYRGG